MGFWPLLGDNATCGDGWRPQYGPVPPPPTPACARVIEAVVQNCSAARATGNHSVCQRCEYTVRAVAMRENDVNRTHPCQMRELETFCPPAPPKPWQKPHEQHGRHSAIQPFARPDEVFAPEFFPNGSWRGPDSGDADGGFDSHAGLMWLQRVRQYTIANGIAWIILNPYEGDSWDWDTESDWEHGLDRPYLKKLFAAARSGAYPQAPRPHPAQQRQPLFNMDKAIPFGWSAGAQMASWMIEVTASGRFPEAKLASAVMLSGGSHKCYLNNPRSNATSRSKWSPPPPPDLVNVAIGSCANCNSSQSCGEADYINGTSRYNGSSASFMRGCSNSFNTTLKPWQPCCQYCCPIGVTEQWYLDHPQDYKTHVPTFLAQMSSVDINADLCAGKNYHDAMLKHGAISHLELVPKADERCFCVGTPGLQHNGTGKAALGNPYAREGCPIIPPDTHPSQQYHDGLFHCMDHTMGFASMVEPMAQFLVEALRVPTTRSLSAAGVAMRDGE